MKESPSFPPPSQRSQFLTSSCIEPVLIVGSKLFMLGQLDSVHPFRNFQLPGPGIKTVRRYNSGVSTSLSIPPNPSLNTTRTGSVPECKPTQPRPQLERRNPTMRSPVSLTHQKKAPRTLRSMAKTRASTLYLSHHSLFEEGCQSSDKLLLVHVFYSNSRHLREEPSM